HGGGSLRGVLNLNAWLAQEGYLSYAENGTNGGGAHRLFELRRKLPNEWRYTVKQRLPWLRERTYRLRRPSVVDWPRTRAFAYGTFGNVVLNVAGRERDGIVEPGQEYEDLREELAERLLALEIRGERIVAAVHRREDLFAGPELDKVPDLVVEFRDYAWLGKGNLIERTASLEDTVTIRAHPQQRYSGGHRPDGIFVLAGPAARAGAKLEAGILDVAPTIMYLLGEPVPETFEGRLLAEALKPSLLDRRPLEFADDDLVAPVPERESPREVEQRLRDLGYLE
ncbi:MAG TPA: hypothetical protein VE757_10330, partial [Gaiellaceae bacterium]|nr:hypothetical protein [Gaiellaceae bacterium]